MAKASAVSPRKHQIILRAPGERGEPLDDVRVSEVSDVLQCSGFAVKLGAELVDLDIARHVHADLLDRNVSSISVMLDVCISRLRVITVGCMNNLHLAGGSLCDHRESSPRAQSVRRPMDLDVAA